MIKFRKLKKINILYLYGEYEALKNELTIYPHELIDSKIPLGDAIKNIYSKFKKPYAVIFYDLQYLKVFDIEKTKYSNLHFNEDSKRLKKSLTNVIDNLVSKNSDSENFQRPSIKTIIFCTTQPTIKNDKKLVNQALKDSKIYNYNVKEYILNYVGEFNYKKRLSNQKDK